MLPLAQLIKEAKSIVLSTHTQPDGDGLGCQVALYWALKKIKKNVRILNVDETPKKYDFLDSNKVIETHNNIRTPLSETDLALIFDTNDQALLLGLWPDLKSKCKRVVFVDHHPLLSRHPINKDEHVIDMSASSTGEIVFNLVKSLGIELDKNIALPLYTSIVFDTNYFRYIRNSATPHLMAAELLKHDIEPQKVHRHLFGNHSPSKLKFLSQILGLVEYELGGRLACVRVRQKDMVALGLEMDETRDIIDMVMNVESIEAAVLFREDSPDQFKLSFRSKGLFSVNELAESLGGGGHEFASGAFISSSYSEIKQRVLREFERLFDKLDEKAFSG